MDKRVFRIREVFDIAYVESIDEFRLHKTRRLPVCVAVKDAVLQPSVVFRDLIERDNESVGVNSGVLQAET